MFELGDDDRRPGSPPVTSTSSMMEVGGDSLIIISAASHGQVPVPVRLFYLTTFLTSLVSYNAMILISSINHILPTSCAFQWT
jgi:hypothetical protein